VLYAALQRIPSLSTSLRHILCSRATLFGRQQFFRKQFLRRRLAQQFVQFFEREFRRVQFFRRQSQFGRRIELFRRRHP
jgi:hypothetical protein